MLETRPEFVILLMGANPEPGNNITLKESYHPVVVAGAGRINGEVALTDLFELQTRMARVFLKEFVVCPYLALGMVRQRIKKGFKSLCAS